jgi:hypothetical protein
MFCSAMPLDLHMSNLHMLYLGQHFFKQTHRQHPLIFLLTNRLHFYRNLTLCLSWVQPANCRSSALLASKDTVFYIITKWQPCATNLTGDRSDYLILYVLRLWAVTCEGTRNRREIEGGMNVPVFASRVSFVPKISFFLKIMTCI